MAFKPATVQREGSEPLGRKTTNVARSTSERRRTSRKNVGVGEFDSLGVTRGARSVHDTRNIVGTGVIRCDDVLLAELEELLEREDADPVMRGLDRLERTGLDILQFAVVDDDFEGGCGGDDRRDGGEEVGVREESVGRGFVDGVTELRNA